MIIYFEMLDPQTPGANAYNMEELMKGTGSIYNSKFKSSTSNTISKRFKDPVYSKLITPGPGAYQTFSEFGIYRSKYADKVERKENEKSRSKRSSKPIIRKSKSVDDFDEL